MNNIKTYLLTLILSISTTAIWAQMPDSRYYRQLPDYPFVIVSEDHVSEPPVISDSLFDAASRGIRFKVNRTELQSTDPFIPLYIEHLVPWLKENELELRQVYVRGAASPEGPYNNNVRLSKGRTQRLIEFLSSHLGQSMDGTPISAQNITEDYGLLVKNMQAAGDRDYERVRDLWLDCHGDEACCKRRLMALDGGTVWYRLMRDYFPALRQARVILWFALKADAQPRKYEPIKLAQPVVPPVAEIDYTPMPPEIKYKRRHLIAARTNLIHDLLYVPQFGWAYGGNIQLEYYPLNGHFTYNAGFTFTNHRHWEDYKFFQIRDLQLELRRYFKGGGAFIGPFLSAYLEGTVYGIGFSKTKGWEGEGGGAGVGIGYTCRLNRKGSLRLEFSASFGFFYSRQDPYVYGNPISSEEDGLYYYDYHGRTKDFKKRNHWFSWFGPTNAGIHITYDIIYRKKKPVTYYDQEGGSR